MSSQLSPRKLYYDGRCQSGTGGTFRSINPASAEVVADVDGASESDIDAAVQSAVKAFPSWSKTPAIVRSRLLHKAASILRDNNNEIARIETLDTGKPFSETSVVDVVTGADVLEYYANLIGGGGLFGERIQLREGAWCVSTKEPLGVCVGIGAWNYPIQM